MQDPTTPSRPPAVTFTDIHTEASPINTPSQANLQRVPKRTKFITINPPPKVTMAGKDNHDDNESLLRDIITKQYAKIDRENDIRREVTTALATALNKFVGSFKRVSKASHRQMARNYAKTLGQHLNVTVYAQSGGSLIAPIRPASTQAKTETEQLSRTSATSYAEAAQGAKLKPSLKPAASAAFSKQSAQKSTASTKAAPKPRENHRVLVRVREKAPATTTAAAFAARTALLKNLQLPNDAIRDVQPIKTG
ncbi:hypothetical protein F5Y14DRAFT_414169 [Nemania sp. NC0429]|nr:hypothetical protein F5Y14DRAFT_414169 [Nemania sp. NC0429]